MAQPATDIDRIIDTALALAQTSSWEALRLHAVADALGIGLDDIRRHFREKDQIIDAWFDRADAAMLRRAHNADFLALGTRARLQRLIMAWLEALAPHRRVTRQMVWGRLEPGHLHIQIPALMRVSRTVQWMREAAHCDARYLCRALEETALTTIYLTVFCHWLRDDSADSVRTQRLLERLLGAVDSIASRVYPGADKGVRRPTPGPAPAQGN